MLTGELKNKIDFIWEMFWTGGITNPLDVVEQMTYLMFIHDLDETDAKKAKSSIMLELPYTSIFEGHDQYKWSVFRDLPAEKVYELMQTEIFPFIKNLHDNKDSTYARYMSDAIFKIPTPQLLSKIIDALDNLYADMSKNIEADTKGDVYESLLAKLSTAGVNGQFRTPRHIIRMMVELLDPKPVDVICDPACGTSGFLVAAGEYLKEKYHDEIFYNREKKDHYNNYMFYGYDMDRTMLRVGAMNMMTHGVDNPNIDYRDSLSDQNLDNGKYTVILANPPFKGSLDADTVSADLLKVCKTKKTELLFLALFLRMLKIGGRCACIVPDGVLFGSSTAHKAIRKEIIENNRLEAVISMPSGVFKPYAGVSTGILIFTKTGHGGTDNVWFYDMQADGFSLDDKRTAISDNDIPDIIARFRNLDDEKDRERTEKSFFVPKQEIIDNDYDLSINKYKKTEYVAVEYPASEEIIGDLNTIHLDIVDSLKSLASSLQEAIAIRNPFKEIQSAVDDLRQKVTETWWAAALEVENEAEWNDKKYNSSLCDYMNGEYGFEYIRKYLKDNLNNTKIVEAIKCYDMGLYYSCSCVLATTIEEQLIKYDLVTSTKLKSRFEKLLCENNPWVYAGYAMEQFYERFAMDTRGTPYSFDSTEPNFLNRNWLLHGRIRREINEFDCLQLFCALYAILVIENNGI